MKVKFSVLLLLFFAATASAQVEQVDWINTHAVSLSSDGSSSDKDLGFLSNELSGRTVVGLGEASHGTSEFYLQKARIIQYLVKNSDYRVFAMEFADSFISPVNQYVQTGKGDLRALMRPFALYNTKEIFDLFSWIRQFNENRAEGDRVEIIGVDRQEYWRDAYTRDRYMAENLMKSYLATGRKTILWGHNLHIAEDTTMAKFPAMGYHLKEQLGEQYYTIGFDTYQGTVNVLNQGNFEMHRFGGKENTFSATFAKAKSEVFFLSFHQRESPFTQTTGLITNIYSNWQEPTPLPVRLGADFDALIFIRNTSASRKMDVE